MRSAQIRAIGRGRSGDGCCFGSIRFAALIENQLNDLQDGKGYSARIDVERELSPTTGIGATVTRPRGAEGSRLFDIGWRAGLVGWRDLGRMTSPLTASSASSTPTSDWCCSRTGGLTAIAACRSGRPSDSCSGAASRRSRASRSSATGAPSHFTIIEELEPSWGLCGRSDSLELVAPAKEFATSLRYRVRLARVFRTLVIANLIDAVRMVSARWRVPSLESMDQPWEVGPLTDPLLGCITWVIRFTTDAV